MRTICRSDGKLGATAALLTAAVACSVESPASTPITSTPAILFTHATVESAWQAATTKRRPIVVLFTTDRCPHCERMLTETYAHVEIRRLLSEHAETALAHTDDYRELAKRLGIRGYPTSVIVSAEGQIVGAIEGYVDAAAFAERVRPWIAPRPQGSATAQPLPTVAASR